MIGGLGDGVQVQGIYWRCASSCGVGEDGIEGEDFERVDKQD